MRIFSTYKHIKTSNLLIYDLLIYDLPKEAQNLLKHEARETAIYNAIVFGECKWTNEKVDLGVLEGLVEKAKDMGNVILVSYGDMVTQKY